MEDFHPVAENFQRRECKNILNSLTILLHRLMEQNPKIKLILLDLNGMLD